MPTPMIVAPNSVSIYLSLLFLIIFSEQGSFVVEFSPDQESLRT